MAIPALEDFEGGRGVWQECRSGGWKRPASVGAADGDRERWDASAFRRTAAGSGVRRLE
jgi:hypothetical protein